MSRALGTVYEGREPFGYFIYDGTCDFCYPAVYATKDIAFDNFRTDAEVSVRCTCINQNLIDVILYNNYGNGKEWEGTMCTNCKCIVDGLTEPQPYFSRWYEY